MQLLFQQTGQEGVDRVTVKKIRGRLTMVQRKGLMGCVLLASTSLSTGAALAQQASAGGSANATAQSTTLEEIIVTAQKRSERLLDVPLSVTVTTGDQLAKQGITNTADLEKAVPGFTYVQSSFAAPIYTIRGIGTYDEAIAISPAVTVYMDQVPLPFSRMTEGTTLDLQRVEVLKGPQGTLFGQNSTGGAINYIPNQPTDYFAAGTGLTYGRFNELDANGYVSGPLTDGVNARLAFRTEHRDDWQRSYTTNQTLGQRNFTTARFLLDARPNDRLDLEFSANGWSDRSDTQAKQKIGYAPETPGGFPGAPGYPNLQAQLQAYPNAPNDARAADWDPGAKYARNDSFYQTYLRGEYSLTDRMTLTSMTSYSHLNVYTPTENDGTTLPNSSILALGHISSVAQELRLAGARGPDNQLKWMAGANYEYDDTLDPPLLGINSTNSGIGPFRFTGLRIVNSQKINTGAVFSSLDYAVTSTVSVYGSARYTRRDDKFNSCLADDGNGDLASAFSFLSTLLSGSPTVIPVGGCVTLDPVTNKPLTNGINSSQNQDNVSWRGGGSWRPTADVMLYANVTKGYKGGSYGTVAAIRPIQAAPDTQESVLAYEVGFKALVLDRKAQIDGAVFDYDYQHKQLLGSVNLGPPFGTLQSLVSIPKSRVDGAELNLTARPVPGLTVRVGGTYIDSEVRGNFLLANPLSGPAVNVNRNSFPNTPKWQATSDIEYDHRVANDWSGFIGGGLSYRSSTLSFFGGNQFFEIPGRTLLDLRAGFERNDRLRVEFWGHNVTDQFYTTFVSRITDTITRTVGVPSTWGVTISYEY
jgi:iron complex outermembrane receptor protein